MIWHETCLKYVSTEDLPTQLQACPNLKLHLFLSKYCIFEAVLHPIDLSDNFSGQQYRFLYIKKSYKNERLVFLFNLKNILDCLVKSGDFN